MKNLKGVIVTGVTVGIVTIGTVAIMIGSSTKDDVAEAEVNDRSAEIVTEVETEVETEAVTEVTTEVVTTEASIIITTQTKEEVTTEKQEPVAENVTEKKQQTKQSKKVTQTETKSETKSEKKSETKSETKSEVKESEKKSEEPVMSNIKTGNSEDKKKDDAEAAKIVEEKKIIEEQKKAEEEAKKAKEEESAKYEGDIKLQYSAAYNICDGHLTRSNGSIRYNGHRETWYSTNEAAGKATAWSIPGKHVADDGTIRDVDGYICVASSDYRHGTVIMTSVGPGKVYDCGCSHGTVDVYTNW